MVMEPDPKGAPCKKAYEWIKKQPDEKQGGHELYEVDERGDDDHEEDRTAV